MGGGGGGGGGMLTFWGISADLVIQYVVKAENLQFGTIYNGGRWGGGGVGLDFRGGGGKFRAPTLLNETLSLFPEVLILCKTDLNCSHTYFNTNRIHNLGNVRLMLK